MKKKSTGYYKYLQDMANGGKLSYYESDEIVDAVYDLLDEGRIDDAQSLIEKGLEQHPADEELELILVWILIHAKKLKDASTLFAKHRDSDNDLALRLKFCFEVIEGHPHQALSRFLPLLSSQRIHALDWLNTIDDMFSYLTPETLAPYLIQAMDMMPEIAEAWGHLGGLLMDLQQLNQAIIALEHAIDIDAYDIYSWQDLCRCYFVIGEMDKCADACEYGLAIDPKNPLFSLTRAYIYYDNEQYAEAIPHLENARLYFEGGLQSEAALSIAQELREHTDITYQMLAFSYQKTDQIDKALECFDILCERRPKEVEVSIRAATLYLEKGDVGKAYNLISEALQYHPKEVALLTMKVTLLTTLHQFDEANETLDRLITLKPRTYAYRMAKAELCLSLNRREEADAAFRQLLEMNPRDKAVRRMLIDYFTSIDDQTALLRLNQSK